MSLLAKALLNIRDMRFFGPSVIARHLARWRADRIATVSVPGIGPVAVRVDQTDLAAVRQIFCGGEYDLEGPLGALIGARYRAIVAQGGVPIIVDAGANIGAASLWFMRKFPAARIVAVEPDPDNAKILRRNLHRHANGVVLEAAIGSTSGFVSFTTQGSGWAVQTERATSGVRIVTIDEALDAAQGDTPFIVKIDIEGFESDLFAHDVGWIDRCFAVMIEPHDWMLPGQGTSRNFQQAMAQRPFELALQGENLIYVRTEAGKDRDQPGNALRTELEVAALPR